MHQILKSLILDSHNPDTFNGLLTIPAPTGFGKTYLTCDFIAEYFQVLIEQNKQVIFTTPLLKNLPEKELKEAFKRKGLSHLFEEEVLFLSNIESTFKQEFLDVCHLIPSDLKQTDSYKNLFTILSTSKEVTGYDLSQTKFSEYELKFRKELVETLFGNDVRLKEKKQIIQASESEWIRKLYPGTQIQNKTLLVMSVSKLINPFTTLIEPSKPLLEMLSRDTVVFMDEFDSCKQPILAKIIESGLKYTFDPVRLLSSIYQHINQRKTPQKFISDSSARKEKANELGWPTIEENFNELARRLKELYEKYNLNLNIKNSEVSDSRHFFFSDYESFGVFKNLEVRSVAKDNVNWLIDNKDQDYGNSLTLERLVNAVQTEIRYLRRHVLYMAENYMQYHNEQLNEHSGIKDEMTLNQALHTVLNQYGIPEQNGFRKRFFDASLEYESHISFKFSELEDLHSFYDLGFSYFFLEDNPEHDSYTLLKNFAFYDTPESYLVSLCNKSLVIGLSATAQSPSPLKNFDLDFLSAKLGKKFIELNNEELNRIQDEFNQAIAFYDNIQIDVEAIYHDSSHLEECIHLLNDSALGQNLHDHIVGQIGLDKGYVIDRYLNLFKVMKTFIQDASIYAYLALFSIIPQKGKADFDTDIIKNVFELLRSTFTPLYSANVEVLTSNNFQEQFNDIKDRLSQGEKILVVSAYATLGAGQNLQYLIPEFRNTMLINSRPPDSAMDFNGLYLDAVSNVIPYIDKNQKSDGQVKSIVDRIFKIESLSEKGDISYYEKINLVKGTFGNSTQNIKTKNKLSYYQAEMSVLVQAVGRLCRTNQKAPKVHIALAPRWVEVVQHCLNQSTGLMLPEVKAIVEYVKRLNIQSTINTNPLLEKALSHHRKSFRFIAMHLTAFANGNASAKYRRNWLALRDYCLRYPYFNEVHPGFKQACFLESHDKQIGYWYQSSDSQLRNVDISFSFDSQKYGINQFSPLLDQLMQTPGLKDYFGSRGWKTHFEPAKYWLVPCMMQNIYQGALGEEIGRYVFEKLLSIPLNEMPDEQFEVFDFKVNDSVYIDFKFWPNFEVNAADYQQKLIEKLNRVDGKTALIINIYGQQFASPVNHSSRVVEIPSLLVNGQMNPESITLIRNVCNG